MKIPTSIVILILVAACITECTSRKLTRFNREIQTEQYNDSLKYYKNKVKQLETNK
jgi:hypothetical protein